jgi:ParB-like chromosome segregation protein Spo0J
VVGEPHHGTQAAEVSAVSTELQVHPLVRDLFPPMDDAAFEAFVADINAHEQREPIVMFEDAILDGYHRYRACRRLGIEPNFTAYMGDDPVSYAVSLNLRRRHLDESQRSMVAAKLATMKRGDNQHSPIGECSQARAADLLNVGKRSVERAREVLDHGTPELAQAVERGEVSVSAAATVASLPEDEQREVLADGGAKAVAAKAREIREERAAEHAAARKWDTPDTDDNDNDDQGADQDAADQAAEDALDDEAEPEADLTEDELNAIADAKPADWRYWSRHLGADRAKRIRKTCLDTAGEVRALYDLDGDTKEKLIAAAERGETVSAVAVRDKLEAEAKALAEWLIDTDIDRAKLLVRVLDHVFTSDAFTQTLEGKVGSLLDDGDDDDQESARDNAAA